MAPLDRPDKVRGEVDQGVEDALGMAKRFGFRRVVAVWDRDSVIPAALADRIPLVESSIAAQAPGSTSSRFAAFR